MSMPLRNVLIAIVSLMVGIGFLALSTELPDRTIQNVPGPAFFPGIVGSVIVLLSLALLAKGLFALKTGPLLLAEASLPVKGIAVFAWFLLFLAGLPYAGFLMLGIPFFAGLMMMCSIRNPLHIAFGSVLVPVFLYFLFRDGFNILLPTASWM